MPLLINQLISDLCVYRMVGTWRDADTNRFTQRQYVHRSSGGNPTTGSRPLYDHWIGEYLVEATRLPVVRCVS